MNTIDVYMAGTEAICHSFAGNSPKAMQNYKKRGNENIKTLSDTRQEDEQFSDPVQSENIQLTSPIQQAEVIFIEPFYGGSHKQLINILRKHVPNSHLITLTAKKWHWRARCSSLMVSSMIPQVTTERILFCSSVLSLAELLGLRPDLCGLKKVVYFHENQLVYPIREIKARDVQFAYNQITTCLAADLVIFNSHYNKSSFLDNIKTIIKMLPDNRPKDLRDKIERKTRVLYFPLHFSNPFKNRLEPLHSCLQIVWPHRWEFDKDPEMFINVLLRLKSDGLDFRVAILGETFTDTPAIFAHAKEALKDEVVNFGFVHSKEEYFEVLCSSRIVVSTAKHEFFGVSMLEACFSGCFPLVPNRLVYPEIYPTKCLYQDENELFVRLKEYCLNPASASEHWRNINWEFDKYSEDTLILEYLKVLKA